MDLPESAAQLAKFKRRYKSVDVLEISCATGDGLDKLKKELLKRVSKFRAVEKASHRNVTPSHFLPHVERTPTTDDAREPAAGRAARRA
jgi:50S ribosomal subunit-associated GTPase HflX